MTDISDRVLNKVLIVEDEKEYLSLLGFLCAQMGVEADLAQNGQKALEMYMQNKSSYRVIITDCDMPLMTGFDLVRKIRENGNGVPVVLSSGKRLRKTEWQEMGFDGYLAKPYSCDDFTDFLRKYLPELQNNAGNTAQ